MKKYIAYKGYRYYPSLGINDFIGSFDDLQEARVHVKTYKADDFDCSYWWGQIVDMSGEHPVVVWSYDYRCDFEKDYVESNEIRVIRRP